MQDRTIILHYHLFKNAGTSVDKILQDNFPERWVTMEFAPTRGNNTPQVEEWIRANPDAIAFSSHTMLGPMPKIDNTRIVTVVMLRNPIDRIRSAYKFERRQVSDNFGSVLAKHTSFEGYIRCRLALGHDRQCRNFQTFRLASLVPPPGKELDRAVRALSAVDVFGTVDDFTGAMHRLQHVVRDSFPDFSFEETRQNRSEPGESPLAEPDAGVEALLVENNQCDLALLEAAREKLLAATA